MGRNARLTIEMNVLIKDESGSEVVFEGFDDVLL